jgi:hypothetical protein
MASDDVGGQAAARAERRSAAAALLVTAVVAVAFTVFAAVTTQDKGVRAASPWQDDPYDGVVSFTLFLVPLLTGLGALRAVRWGERRGQRARLRQLVRAAVVCTTLVAATLGADWVAVAVGAERDAWNGTTGWLTGALSVLTCLAAAGYAAGWRALRRLPRPACGEGPEGDWLDDLLRAGESLAGRLTGTPRQPAGGTRVVRFVRGHVPATAAGLGLAAGLAITTAEAVGEGWTSPLLFLTGTAIGTGGFYALGILCNAALHVVRPTTTAPRTMLHRAGHLALLAAAAALPVAAVLRDDIWRAAGLAGEVDSPERFAGVAFGGALLGGLLVFGAALATAGGRSPRRGPC